MTKWISVNGDRPELFSTEGLVNVFRSEKDGRPIVKFTYTGSELFCWMPSREAADAEVKRIINLLKENNPMSIKSFADEVKSFLPSPTQALMFVVVIFVLDKFIMGGALREYVQDLLKGDKKDAAVTSQSSSDSLQ